MGALSHLKILDLSRVLAGPWAGQLLGDLGAEVIKIERPGTGDDTRSWGPPFVTDPATGAAGDAAYFLAANRNKQSVTADLATAEGRDLVRGLALESDVLIEIWQRFKQQGVRVPYPQRDLHVRSGVELATLQALA